MRAVVVGVGVLCATLECRALPLQDQFNFCKDFLLTG